MGDSVKLYDCEAVGIAAFIGSPLAGATLMAMNEHRLGRTPRVVMTMLVGLAATGALFAVSILTQGTIRGLGFAIPLLVRYWAKVSQGDDVTKHVAAGGPLGSKWIAAGVGLLGLAMAVFAIIGISVVAGGVQAVASSGPGLPYKASENEIVFYKGGASRGDAERLAETLKKAQYFNGSRHANVLLRKEDDGWVVSFCVKKDSWKNQDMVDAFTVIGSAIRATTFNGAPLELQLCDGNLAVHRRIPITVKAGGGVAPETAETNRKVSQALLFEAIAKDRPPDVRRLLEAGADPNLADEKNRRPISFAALTGKGACLEALVKGGGRLDLRYEKGFTLLQLVVIKGEAEMVERLLRLGAEPNDVVGKDGYSALHFAANLKSAAKVKALLAAKAKVNIADASGCTPLFIAALQESKEVVKLMLEAGADPDFKNKRGDTVLHTLVAMGKTDMALWLLKAGAKPTVENAAKATALHLAAAAGHAGLIPPMIAVGAVVDGRSKDGATPLIVAVATGHGEVLRALLQAGADPNSSPPQKHTALELAIRKGQKPLVEILLASPKIHLRKADADGARAVGNPSLALQIESLARKRGGPAHAWARGAAPPLAVVATRPPPPTKKPTAAVKVPSRKATKDERRALARAAMAGDGAAIGKLLDDGVSVDQVISKGRTALHYAAVKGKAEVVRLLLARGADHGRQVADGRRALFLAARAGHGDVVKALLEGGADPNVADDKGYTALHAAVSRGEHEIARLLLAGGARAEGGKASRSPLAMAEGKEDRKMVELLKGKGH